MKVSLQTSTVQDTSVSPSALTHFGFEIKQTDETGMRLERPDGAIALYSSIQDYYIIKLFGVELFQGRIENTDTLRSIFNEVN